MLSVTALCVSHVNLTSLWYVTPATKISIHNLYFMTYLKDCKKFVTLKHIAAKIRK